MVRCTVVSALAGAGVLLSHTANAQSVTSRPDGYAGDTSCPCLDLLPGLALNGDDSYFANPLLGPHGPALSPLTFGYGVEGCKAYDNDNVYQLQNCLSRSPVTTRSKDNCPKKWCFVDANDCDIGKDLLPATLFNNAPAVNISVSYSTCGEMGNIDQTEALYKLIIDSQTKPLRVSFPTNGDSGTGYTLNTNPDAGPGDAVFTGSTADFAYELFNTPLPKRTSLSIEWEYVPVSEEASQSDYAESEFTHCVMDVAFGNVDLCVGNFWETKERRGLTEFTTRLYTDEIIAIVPNTIESATDLEQLTASFRGPLLPFTDELWLVLLATTLFVGLSMWYLEGFTNSDNIPEALYDVPRAILEGMFHGWYIALYGLLTLDFRWDPEGVFAKIFCFLYGYLLLIVLAYYTGQVTNVLLDDGSDTEIKSFVEGIEKDWNFCGMEAIKNQIVSQVAYSALAAPGRYVSFNVPHDVLYGLDLGLCQGAILSRDEWSNAFRGGPFNMETGEPEIKPYYTTPEFVKANNTYQSFHCLDKVPLEGIDTTENAFPVAAEYQAALSWKISEMVSAGRYNNYASQPEQYGLPEARCEKNYADVEELYDDYQVDVRDIGGLLVLLVGSGVLVTLGHLLFEFIKHKNLDSKIDEIYPYKKSMDREEVVEGMEALKEVLFSPPSSLPDFIIHKKRRDEFAKQLVQGTEVPNYDTALDPNSEDNDNDAEKNEDKLTNLLKLSGEWVSSSGFQRDKKNSDHDLFEVDDKAMMKTQWYQNRDLAVLEKLNEGAEIAMLPHRRFDGNHTRSPDVATPLSLAHVPALARLIADCLDERANRKDNGPNPLDNAFYKYDEDKDENTYDDIKDTNQDENTYDDIKDTNQDQGNYNNNKKPNNDDDGIVDREIETPVQESVEVKDAHL